MWHLLRVAVEWIKQILQEQTASGSRSNVLRSLAAIDALALVPLGGSIVWGVDQWIIICAFVFFGICLLVTLGAFLYCLFKDPDLLRTEKYQIEKLAIERGLLGDSEIGLSPATDENLKVVGDKSQDLKKIEDSR